MRRLLTRLNCLRDESNKREAVELNSRHSEITFRTIVDTSLEAIGISTLPDLRIVYANEAFAKITRYSRADLLGRATDEISSAHR